MGKVIVFRRPKQIRICSRCGSFLSVDNVPWIYNGIIAVDNMPAWICQNDECSMIFYDPIVYYPVVRLLRDKKIPERTDYCLLPLSHIFTVDDIQFKRRRE